MGLGRLGILVFVGCGRVAFDETSGGDSGRAPGPGVTHLAPADWTPGTGVVVISGASTLDTAMVTLDGNAAAPGSRLFVTTQTGGGPEVVVLAVDSLSIPPAGSLRVIGSRPLVIVAADTVDVQGTIDASARHATPGAGGANPGAGGGAGQPGINSGLYDSGGAGGGFGTSGANGGIHACNGIAGGVAGIAQGDATLSTLIGGSGGGAGSPGTCTAAPGGAGGGGLQVTAGTAITVSGLIDAGGGGGGGGAFCNGNDGGAGSGGGAGGGIFFEAPSVTIGGVVAANGGAGGAGGGPGGPPGDPGADGTIGLVAATAGGNTGGGAPGGAGGWRDAVPIVGGSGTCSGPAGGGGGAVGRIAIRATTRAGAGTITPAPVAF